MSPLDHAGPPIPQPLGLPACVIQQDLMSSSGSPPFHVMVRPGALTHKGAHLIYSGLRAQYACAENLISSFLDFMISKYRLLHDFKV